MSKPLALQGQLIDVKNVASHKCVRLSIDVPAEQGEEVVRLFGWPTGVDPVPVAVARLHVGTKGGANQEEATKPGSAQAPAGSGKRHFNELRPSAQAALRCKEPEFWEYITDHHQKHVRDEEDAADFVRAVCVIPSRGELDRNHIAAGAWAQIESSFEAWRLAQQHERH
jgi:hypothetical protein